jgi:prepilin-type processing-associated H-X9-DG protein
MPEQDRPWEHPRDRDDDDDDRPRRRKRSDDDDDRPSRNKQDDDDDDDRPRRRKRDEDDDDRPRRRSGKKSKSPVLLIVLVVLVLCSCICVPVLIGLLLPAVTKVREAAARMKDQNNLKQISLATMNYEDKYKGIDAPYAHDQFGKLNTGLSFRVGLLPYMEQGLLYDRFDLSQSWNSARNQQFSNTVVPPYATPLDQPAGTMTPYRAFVGGGAIFNEDGSMVRLRDDVPDGLSNTILYIQAVDSVPWAKPQEIPYSPTTPLPTLGRPGMTNGTNAAMADGSVRFIRKDISERTFRALITRAGHDVIGPDGN